MNFLIITQAEHKINADNTLGGYAPYIKEMNLWAKYVDTITLVGPIEHEAFNAIDIPLQHAKIQLVPIEPFNFKNIPQALKSVFRLPGICFKVYRQMRKADHIHLRCPGNMGLIGCLMQFFFPKTKKTAKYAGNWDWASKQPKSYRFQQHLLRNTWFTKNMQVLVYGHWPDGNQNILPFFTASYSETDLLPVAPRKLDKQETIRLIYVGAF